MLIVRLFTLMSLKCLICMYHPPTTSHYPLRFNIDISTCLSEQKTTWKGDSANITPTEPTIKILFHPIILWQCNPGQLTEWRELCALLMTPACCAVQEDTALTHIHHTDNCKVHSFAHDKSMWPQCHRLLIGILRGIHIPIFTVPLFISCLIKATVNWQCHNTMKKTFGAAIFWITSGERASYVVNAYLKRQAKLLVSGVWWQSDELY